MKKFKLGCITKEQAEYIMGAASVAGGWILIPGEWANCVRFINALQAHPAITSYLALLPQDWDEAIRDVAVDEVIANIKADIEHVTNRLYCKGSIESDLYALHHWLGKLEEAKQLLEP